MTRAERARRIAAILEGRIGTPPIPLDHASPFRLLVAVLLSAQCTDERVNQVTPALFAMAPDAATMAGCSPAEILLKISRLGLARTKARHVAHMAALLCDRHGGEVPADQVALEALPGVGHKTASVVMAQAFGVPSFPVDTHIHRLAGRWQLSRARNVAEVERDLRAVFPRERWNLLHLQIIYFGRRFCPARGHVPTACPICSWAMSAARARAEVASGTGRPG